MACRSEQEDALQNKAGERPNFFLPRRTRKTRKKWRIRSQIQIDLLLKSTKQIISFPPYIPCFPCPPWQKKLSNSFALQIGIFTLLQNSSVNFAQILRFEKGCSVFDSSFACILYQQYHQRSIAQEIFR